MKCDQNQENPIVSLLLCLLTLKTAVLRHLKILQKYDQWKKDFQVNVYITFP